MVSGDWCSGNLRGYLQDAWAWHQVLIHSDKELHRLAHGTHRLASPYFSFLILKVGIIAELLNRAMGQSLVWIMANAD